MATPTYKFWRSRPTEAWYQLSKDEQDKHTAQMEQALQKAGGKRIVACTPAWSTPQWLLCGVEVFPDVEAVQKHTELIYALDHFRYFESETMLGTEWPPA
jgi:hypothetical protein